MTTHYCGARASPWPSSPRDKSVAGAAWWSSFSLRRRIFLEPRTCTSSTMQIFVKTRECPTISSVARASRPPSPTSGRGVFSRLRGADRFLGSSGRLVAETRRARRDRHLPPTRFALVSPDPPDASRYGRLDVHCTPTRSPRLTSPPRFSFLALQSRVRPSPSRWSRWIASRMLKPRFRTKSAFAQAE